MHITWACGKKILVSDREFDEQIDIGTRMKKRAQKGYGLHVSDCTVIHGWMNLKIMSGMAIFTLSIEIDRPNT